MKTLSKKQTKMLNSLREHLGIVSKASAACGVHRNSHNNWIKSNDAYSLEYENILNECIDFVEDALYDKIKEGDTTSIIFYLKCKGKTRGYVERQEIDFGDKANVSIKIIKKEMTCPYR